MCPRKLRHARHLRRPGHRAAGVLQQARPGGHAQRRAQEVRPARLPAAAGLRGPDEQEEEVRTGSSRLVGQRLRRLGGGGDGGTQTMFAPCVVVVCMRVSPCFLEVPTGRFNLTAGVGLSLVYFYF